MKSFPWFFGASFLKAFKSHKTLMESVHSRDVGMILVMGEGRLQACLLLFFPLPQAPVPGGSAVVLPIAVTRKKPKLQNALPNKSYVI